MFVPKFWIIPVSLALADSFSKEMTWTCSLSWRERCSCGEEGGGKQRRIWKKKSLFGMKHTDEAIAERSDVNYVPLAQCQGPVFLPDSSVCVCRGEGGARAVIATVIGLDTAVTAWTWAKRTVSFVPVVPGLLFNATVALTLKIFVCCRCVLKSSSYEFLFCSSNFTTCFTSIKECISKWNRLFDV